LLQLLQPIWLWLTAGIIIPVMIHLWNIRPGKTLAVGSIALLKENGRPSSRSLQWSDLLLLLLRCLLIILLALLLAKPVWRAASVKKEKGWVLIAQSGLEETYRQFQPQVDSLLQAGYSFHYFAAGFPGEDLQTALRHAADAEADSASYWALLDSLQQHPQAPATRFLFTPHYLSRFHGQRPHIDTGTHWYVYQPADSVSNWQAGSYVTASGSVRTRKVSSRASGNSYIYEHLPAASAQTDTATRLITVFADTYAHDASYLQAAITAIQEFTARKIRLSVISELRALPAQTDWLFWLSPQPIPEQVKSDNIWRYDSGTVVNASSWIISNEATPVPLFKRIQAAPPVNGLVQWKDGYGNAILYLEQINDTRVYHFTSRLDPAWNELPWNAAFPGLLLQLLYPDSLAVPADKDRRAIAAQQLRPDQYNAERSSKRTTLPVTDLGTLIWVMVFIVFLAERIWVFTSQRTSTNG
jgi:N-terminal double-transmembrane domain